MREERATWALVTGATSGLGEAIAERLVIAGYHVMIVGRSAEALERASAGLSARARYPHQRVLSVSVDLHQVGAADQLLKRAKDKALSVAILAAADYAYGAFTEITPERHEQLIQCNIIATARLIQGVLDQMDQQRRGRVLVVGSLGAMMPSPYQSAYTASKAWLHQFISCVQAERGRRPVTLTLGCPGGMKTPMLLNSPAWTRLRRLPWVRLSIITPQAAARILLRATFAGRLRSVPGILNGLTALSLRVIPHRVSLWLGRSLFGRQSALDNKQNR